MKRRWKWNNSSWWTHERHKSHLIALFIHRKVTKVIRDFFLMYFFMPLYGLKLISAASPTALNNRYQRNISSSSSSSLTPFYSYSALCRRSRCLEMERKFTLILMIKFNLRVEIMKADDEGGKFIFCPWDVIESKTNHLLRHVLKITVCWLPAHLLFPHQIKDNERIFRILTQFP